MREIDAYHGCSAEVGRGILAGAPMEPSRRDYDWLGEGVYFWENDSIRAWEWADWKVGRGDFDVPFVLGVKIDLGECLDLMNRKSHIALAKIFKALVLHRRRHGVVLPRNEKAHSKDKDYVLSYLDCAVINHLHTYMVETNEKPFDTVRGVFTEGKRVYPGARFRDRTHIQIAVRDPGLIYDCYKVERPTLM